MKRIKINKVYKNPDWLKTIEGNCYSLCFNNHVVYEYLLIIDRILTHLFFIYSLFLYSAMSRTFLSRASPCCHGSNVKSSLIDNYLIDRRWHLVDLVVQLDEWEWVLNVAATREDRG